MTGDNSEKELDKYINNLADIKEETNEQQDDTQSVDVHADVNTDAQEPEQKQEQEQEPEQSEQPAADAQANAQPQRDAQAEDKKKKEKEPSQEQMRALGDGTFANARGDIVSEDGKLIAKNGFAARMYHTNRRLKSQLEERTTQLNGLSQSVGEVKSLATSIQKYGLSNDETAQALDMAGRMKRGDVLGVAKDVLATIAAKGYNVTDLLGSDVGDSIELKAINRMIDERLAPITRQEQDRQQHNEAAQRGKEQYDQFVAQNEYADVHADAIVQVMHRENVNPQNAYNRLLQFATANRLNFSQPLGPQIAARVEEKQKMHEQVSQKPMPNGANTRSSNGAIPAQPLASADDDWGTIISEVQRTIGAA